MKTITSHCYGLGSIPEPASHVGWVCYWFSPRSEGFFPRFLVILTPQKLTNSITIRLRNSGQENHLVKSSLPNSHCCYNHFHYISQSTHLDQGFDNNYYIYLLSELCFFLILISEHKPYQLFFKKNSTRSTPNTRRRSHLPHKQDHCAWRIFNESP